MNTVAVVVIAVNIAIVVLGIIAFLCSILGSDAEKRLEP